MIDYVGRRLQKGSPYSATGKAIKLEKQGINVSIVRISLKKGYQEVVPQGKQAGWKGVINDARQRGDPVYPAGKKL